MSCKTAREYGRHFKKNCVGSHNLLSLGRVKISNLYLPPVSCSVCSKSVPFFSNHPLYCILYNVHYTGDVVVSGCVHAKREVDLPH